MSYHLTIMGSGIHTQRYSDALLFYPRVKNLALINPAMQIPKNTDILIISEPYMITEHVIYKIMQCSNIKQILCEKLPSKKIDETQRIIKQLNEKGLLFIHTRLFESGAVLPQRNNIDVVWPNNYNSGMDPIWHTLPNILDWIYARVGKIPSLVNTELIFNNNDYILTTELQGRKFSFFIMSGNQDDYVYINNEKSPWPNYIDTYHRVFDYFFDNQTLKFENYNYTLSIIGLIESLIKKQKGINR